MSQQRKIRYPFEEKDITIVFEKNFNDINTLKEEAVEIKIYNLSIQSPEMKCFHGNSPFRSARKYIFQLDEKTDDEFISKLRIYDSIFSQECKKAFGDFQYYPIVKYPKVSTGKVCISVTSRNLNMPRTQAIHIKFFSIFSYKKTCQVRLCC